MDTRILLLFLAVVVGGLATRISSSFTRPPSRKRDHIRAWAVQTVPPPKNPPFSFKQFYAQCPCLPVAVLHYIATPAREGVGNFALLI